MSYSERLGPGYEALSISDSIRGSLPPIDVIEELLDSSISDQQVGLERLQDVRKNTKRLRRSVSPILGRLEMSHCPEQDVLSALFLDATIYAANDLILEHHRGGKYGPIGKEYQRELVSGQVRDVIASRRSMQRRIEVFANIYPEADPSLVERSMSAIMYEAYCLAAGTMETSYDRPGQALAGIVAEIKAVRGLKKLGWSGSRLTGVDRDMKQAVDVDVPLTDEDVLPIQVKTNRQFSVSLEKWGEQDGIVIFVCSKRSPQYLDLPGDHLEQLGYMIDEYVLQKYSQGQLTLQI